MAKASAIFIPAHIKPFHRRSFNEINLAMNLVTIGILISGFSFIGYGIAYFTKPHMQREFKRFGLEKAGKLVAVLQLLGALGLLTGLKFPFILLISSGGLAILMFMGVIVRIKLRDGIWLSLPALFFMAVNLYIFFMTLINK